MKRILLILGVILTIGVMTTNAQCCSGTANVTCAKTCSNKSQPACNVKAYYFHGTNRCATCQAVETVTQEALKEYYGEKIAFLSLNIEEEKSNPMIEKYKIAGQTLLIINGDQMVNLTNDAFLNARTNPDKLKTKLKSTIDSML